MISSFAEAIEDSVLCVMNRHDIEDLITKFPSIGVNLLRYLGQRVMELEARLEESSLRDMRSRVVSALLRLRESQGGDLIVVTHQEIAETIGTHRETVTRTLTELRNNGLIRPERNHILITDMPKLQLLINTDYTRGS